MVRKRRGKEVVHLPPCLCSVEYLTEIHISAFPWSTGQHLSTRSQAACQALDILFEVKNYCCSESEARVRKGQTL